MLRKNSTEQRRLKENCSTLLLYRNARHTHSRRAHIVWKLLKMSHLNFSILAFSTNFWPIKIDLSGNTVWPQASGFQKLTKIDHVWPFWLTFVHSKCKRSSLRSYYWMRLFLWFSNTVHTLKESVFGGVEKKGLRSTGVLCVTKMHLQVCLAFMVVLKHEKRLHFCLFSKLYFTSIASNL